MYLWFFSFAHSVSILSLSSPSSFFPRSITIVIIVLRFVFQKIVFQVHSIDSFFSFVSSFYCYDYCDVLFLHAHTISLSAQRVSNTQIKAYLDISAQNIFKWMTVRSRRQAKRTNEREKRNKIKTTNVIDWIKSIRRIQTVFSDCLESFVSSNR